MRSENKPPQRSVEEPQNAFCFQSEIPITLQRGETKSEKALNWKNKTRMTKNDMKRSSTSLVFRG